MCSLLFPPGSTSYMEQCNSNAFYQCPYCVAVLNISTCLPSVHISMEDFLGACVCLWMLIGVLQQEMSAWGPYRTHVVHYRTHVVPIEPCGPYKPCGPYRTMWSL